MLGGITSRLGRSARSVLCTLRRPTRPNDPLRRKLCTVTLDAAAKPPVVEESLLTKGQFDSGFFQGTALFAGVILGVQAASDEQRAGVLNTMVSTFRTLGVSDRITDRQVRVIASMMSMVTLACPID